MRSILVHVGRDAATESRLQTALAIARRHEGHATLLIDTPVANYIVGDPYGGVAVASRAMEEAIAQDDLLAAQIEDRLANEDVPYDVAKSELSLTDALIEAGRFADLVVLSRGCAVGGDLAVELRAPVLVLRDGTALPETIGTACLAWDGGDECATAMRLGAPLLAAAEKVFVVTVGKTAGFPATDALRYLSRHGIKAELVEAPLGDTVEESLLAEVKRLGAQLVAMGAYGHSRTREFLFGGVTRFFLDEKDAPALLLAH